VNIYFWKWLRYVHVARKKMRENFMHLYEKFCNINFERNANNSLKIEKYQKKGTLHRKKGIKAENKSISIIV